MADIAPEVRDAIIKLFNSVTASNPIMNDLLAKQGLTYADAQIYAYQAGKNASNAMVTVLKRTPLPDGKVYYNIAQRTVRPTLEQLYNVVSEYCELTQKQLNTAAGLGLNAIKPELNDDRIAGIVQRLADAEKLDDIIWILKAPVENFARSVVDDSVKANADFHYAAGLKPKIERYSRGKCCKWCANLVGVYDYPLETTEIYRRHENCNCVTEYNPGDGKRQNVWSKRWA